MFYKMLFDRFVDFIFLYTVLDMPRQNCIVLTNVPVLRFVNSDSVLSKTQDRAWASGTLSTTNTHMHLIIRVVLKNADNADTAN